MRKKNQICQKRKFKLYLKINRRYLLKFIKKCPKMYLPHMFFLYRNSIFTLFLPYILFIFAHHTFFLLNMYVRLVYQKFSAWMANHIMQSFITQNPNHEQIVRIFQTCHHHRRFTSHQNCDFLFFFCDGISSLQVIQHLCVGD